jgi:hypothetical protein
LLEPVRREREPRTRSDSFSIDDMQASILTPRRVIMADPVAAPIFIIKRRK